MGAEKWQLTLQDDVKVIKQTSKILVDYCTTPQVKDILHRYNRVHQEGFDSVDWDAMDQAMRESTIRQRHWISKRAARDCGCNYIRFKRRERVDDGCPFCGACETVVHVLTCPSAEPSQLWEATMKDLRNWLSDKGTDPFITDSLITGLHTWRQNPDDEFLLQDDNPLLSAQSEIGWNGILEGCFSRDWTTRQNQFYSEEQSPVR